MWDSRENAPSVALAAVGGEQKSVGRYDRGGNAKRTGSGLDDVASSCR